MPKGRLRTNATATQVAEPIMATKGDSNGANLSFEKQTFLVAYKRGL